MSWLRSALFKATGIKTEKLTYEQVGRLLTADQHSPLLTRRRAVVILSRIRLLSFVSAFLCLAGIGLDYSFFDKATFDSLLIYRILAAFMLLLLVFGIRNADSLQSAYRAMFIFFAANLIFQALFQPLVLPEYLQSINSLPTAGYAIYPFLIAACLAIFPLNIKEVFLATVLFLTAELLIVTLATSELNPQPGLGILISLLSACALSSFSATSQMSYMVSLVEQASIDSLTHCYSRNSGEEILDIQYRIAARQETPLAVIFLDLDDFKVINDDYGHDAGDRILANAADQIRKNMRDSDILIRWGGEEFLMVLPHTGSDGATRAIRRLRSNGLGNRPNGATLTASIGIAELINSRASSWQALVDLADAEMYRAKSSGKDNFSVFDNPETPPVTAKTG